MRYIFSSLLLSAIAHSTPSIADTEVSILDYYPNCSKENSELITVKSKAKELLINVKKNQKQRDVLQAKLLQKIKSIALENNANAIVLLTKKIDYPERLTGNYGGGLNKIPSLKLSYDALLYSECDLSKGLTNELSPIASNGNRNIDSYSLPITEAMSFDIKLEQKEFTKRPKVITNSISLVDGIYGVKIGSTKQSIVSILGTPSVELSSNNLTLYGYGREHWFYFNDNKLIKFQNSTEELSQELVNEIEFLPFFDERKWLVNGVIPFAAEYSTYQNELNNAKQMGDSFLFESESEKLELKFSPSTNFHSGGKKNSLQSIKLQKGSNIPARFKSLSSFDLMSINNLVIKGNHELDTVIELMGEPIAKFFAVDKSQAYLFDDHLMLSFKHGYLSKVTFLENAFSNKLFSNFENKKWNFNRIELAKNYNELKSIFGTDTVEMDNKVEYETELYNVTLFFDEENDNKLYSASFEVL